MLKTTFEIFYDTTQVMLLWLVFAQKISLFCVWQNVFTSLSVVFYANYNVSMCNIFQDMYDLILGYGCHCASHCAKPRTDVVNKLGFTPLTLAAKLARRQVNSLLECF